MIRARLVSILVLLGAPSYLFCFKWHTCMVGHMHHGPYPWHQWASDYLWIGAFIAVALLAFSWKSTSRNCFFRGALFLIIGRLILGSIGGALIIFEIPVLAAMVIRAIHHLRVHREA